jgi:vacuolar protein sorting-associated protein 45
MLHEGLNIKNNRVGLQDAASARELGGEVVLDQTDDDFYRSAQHLNFGELGEAIKKMAEEFLQSEAGSIAMSGGRSKLQSIGDIQR